MSSPATSPRRRQYERRFQIFLVRQFKSLVDPLNAQLIAIPNGEDRSDETLELLEAMGIQEGWPDLALILHDGRVWWIEVKLEATLQHAATGLSKAQGAIHTLLGWFDHPVSVVRTVAEFWAIVDAAGVPHLDLPAPRPVQLVLPRPRRSRKKAA